MTPVGRLPHLRTALEQLAADADEQRALLRGAVGPDELALDWENGYVVARGTQEWRGLGELSRRALVEIDDLVSAPPDDGMWDDAALDDHPAWSRVRSLARALLAAAPTTGATGDRPVGEPG